MVEVHHTLQIDSRRATCSKARRIAPKSDGWKNVFSYSSYKLSYTAHPRANYHVVVGKFHVALILLLVDPIDEVLMAML